MSLTDSDIPPRLLQIYSLSGKAEFAATLENLEAFFTKLVQLQAQDPLIDVELRAFKVLTEKLQNADFKNQTLDKLLGAVRTSMSVKSYHRCAKNFYNPTKDNLLTSIALGLHENDPEYLSCAEEYARRIYPDGPDLFNVLKPLMVDFKWPKHLKYHHLTDMLTAGKSSFLQSLIASEPTHLEWSQPPRMPEELIGLCSFIVSCPTLLELDFSQGIWERQRDRWETEFFKLLIDAIGKSTQIQKVNFGGLWVKDDMVLAVLDVFPKLQSLDSLNLYVYGITDKIAKPVFEFIAKMPSLKHLNIGDDIGIDNRETILDLMESRRTFV